MPEKILPSVYDEYLDSQVDVFQKTRPPKLLTEREKSLISSLKSRALAFTDRYVLLETTDKRSVLYEVRERRQNYLQYVARYTTEKEARQKYDSLTK